MHPAQPHDTAAPPFALSCIRRLGPWDSPAERTAEMWVINRMAAWAHREGIPLDADRVFHPANVERFAQEARGRYKTTADMRSHLHRLGPRLAPKAPWMLRQAHPVRYPMSPPYTDGEVAVLAKAMDEQPTARLLREARAMIGLGLGAGVDGRWLCCVHGSHVVMGEYGIVVEVPDPQPRRVPVLAWWEPVLTALADEAGDEPLVGVHVPWKNRANRIGRRVLTGDPGLRVDARRLRTTWIANHLRSGTPLPLLRDAAGLQTAHTLINVLQFLEGQVGEDAERLMRDATPR